MSGAITTCTDPIITKRGAFDMQLCVPWTWTDAEAIAFAEESQPCGTLNGWQVRQAGAKALLGHPARVQCAARPDFCHIMVDA